MASPQKENGYTPIANELFEAFYQCKLLEYERVCVMHIWRKTYGWNKKVDWIANSQFSTETGIPRPHVTRTLNTLLDKKIILRGKKTITVNKNYDEWKVEWRKLPHQVTRVTSPGNSELPHQVPTKDTITKDNISSPNGEKKDMSFKNMRRYKGEEGGYEEKAIDLDSGEPIVDKDEEARARERELMEWAEKFRGKKFLDRPTQLSFIKRLKGAGVIPATIKRTYMELIQSDYWQEQRRTTGQLPDFKTIFSNLKNKHD